MGSSKIFISYARVEADAVARLSADIESLGFDVWRDRRLKVGQLWWDEIIENIAGCDFFVPAVSPSYLFSPACHRELSYALACRRTVCPVVIADVAAGGLPEELQRRQLLRYGADPATDQRQLLFESFQQPDGSSARGEPLPSPPDPPESRTELMDEALQQELLGPDLQRNLVAALVKHADEDGPPYFEMLRRLVDRHPDPGVLQAAQRTLVSHGYTISYEVNGQEEIYTSLSRVGWARRRLMSLRRRRDPTASRDGE